MPAAKPAVPIRIAGSSRRLLDDCGREGYFPVAPHADADRLQVASGLSRDEPLSSDAVDDVVIRPAVARMMAFCGSQAPLEDTAGDWVRCAGGFLLTQRATPSARGLIRGK